MPLHDSPVISSILERYRAGDETAIIHLLQDMQKAFRYVPQEAIVAAAAHSGVALSRVFEIVTFYKAFSLTPRGEKTLRICTGTSCHIRGAQLVIDELHKVFGVHPGETTGDMRYSIEAVNCVGACALAPVILVEEEVLPHVEPGTVARRLQKMESAQ